MALLATLLWSVPASDVSAGQAAASRPVFEVSVVKKSAELDAGNGSVGLQPGGRFVAVNFDVRMMIAIGYRTSQRLFPSQIIGGPGWLASDRYDVNAKLSDEYRGKTPAELFPSISMFVRSLLEDRFKLRVHHETREQPTYALVLARKDGTFGPKMHRTTADCLVDFAQCRIQSLPGHYSAVGVTLRDFLIMLGGSVERVIIDQTELAGRFDMELDWSPDQSASDKPSLFTALEEQLGLQLKSARAPVDVVVIDSVERPSD
jgi:uncharacterized protein (TIGR03435 family)